MRRDLPACPPPSCRCSSPAPGLPGRPASSERQLLGTGQLQGSGAARHSAAAWLAAALPVALPPPAGVCCQCRCCSPTSCHGDRLVCWQVSSGACTVMLGLSTPVPLARGAWQCADLPQYARHAGPVDVRNKGLIVGIQPLYQRICLGPAWGRALSQRTGTC